MGRTLCHFMQQRIFDPLGISDSQFYPVTHEDLRAHLIDLNPNDPEALRRAELGGCGDMSKTTRGDLGGHGLFLPGVDYMKIMRSFSANDGKLLKPANVDNMFQHHLSPEATSTHEAVLKIPMGEFSRGHRSGNKSWL